MIVWPSVLVFLFGSAALLTGGILGWVTFTEMIEERIFDNVKLVNGSDQYKRWETPSFDVKFKVYIWEVKNPEKVLEGGKPDLVQKGPYVYNLLPKKVDIVREGYNLTYKQTQTYTFDQKDSSPLTEDDEITVLNVPYHAVIQQAEEDDLYWINDDEEIIFNEQGVFLKTTVKALLFDGVPICSEGKPYDICEAITNKLKDSKNVEIEEDDTIKFSFFNHKQVKNTDDTTFKINSGDEQILNMGKILEWNGNDHLTAWKNNEDGSLSNCNMINGTDGHLFAPFVTHHRSIPIFNSDICRSTIFHYVAKRSYMGIRGLMSRIGEDMLPASSLTDDTGCYCLQKTPGILQENGCLKKGAQELHNCFGYHMVLTHPHFFMADKEYQEGVTGIEPDPEENPSSIVVETNTGTLLTGHRRFQYNMFLRKITHMNSTEKVATTLFPILWVEESIKVGDDVVEMLDKELFDPLMNVEATRWSLVGIGIVFLVIGTVWFTVAMNERLKT